MTSALTTSCGNRIFRMSLLIILGRGKRLNGSFKECRRRIGAKCRTKPPCASIKSTLSRRRKTTREKACRRLKYGCMSVDDQVQEVPNLWSDRPSKKKWGDRVLRIAR